MQWDQHDSVKYANINDPHKNPKSESHNQIQNIE